MQRVGETPQSATYSPAAQWPRSESDDSSRHSAGTLADFKVIRRNGAVVGFEPGKISIAMTKAFLAVNGGQGAASARVRELVERLTGDGRRAG